MGEICYIDFRDGIIDGGTVTFGYDVEEAIRGAKMVVITDTADDAISIFRVPGMVRILSDMVVLYWSTASGTTVRRNVVANTISS